MLNSLFFAPRYHNEKYFPRESLFLCVCWTPSRDRRGTKLSVSFAAKSQLQSDMFPVASPSVAPDLGSGTKSSRTSMPSSRMSSSRTCVFRLMSCGRGTILRSRIRASAVCIHIWDRCCKSGSMSRSCSRGSGLMGGPAARLLWKTRLSVEWRRQEAVQVGFTQNHSRQLVASWAVD